MQVNKDPYTGQLYVNDPYRGRVEVTYSPTDYRAAQQAASRLPFEIRPVYRGPLYTNDDGGMFRVGQ